VSEPEDAKNPLEHALDFCVFAPLGFALEARSLLPKFIDRGRNQIVLARVVGKYAVRKGAGAAEFVLAQAQEQATGLLGLGGSGPVAPATPAEHPPPSPTVPEPPLEPPVDPGTLAIPDYDSLSASQVVPRLDGLTTDELEAVREYEHATRARKTILNKIVQLQST
jgi:hypothetical protein